MPRLPLTDQQKNATCAVSTRLFIEAAPGAGKTTVAAERYGVLRFGSRRRSRRSVTAISFTRSATGELTRRVRSRWGSSALTWPHGVTTVDSLLCNILQHLLRRNVIRWPGDHTILTVLDDWRGHRGFRWLTPGNYRRVVALDSSRKVISRGERVTVARPGIGSREYFHGHLAAGLCTHEEIRGLVAAAITDEAMRGVIVELLSSSVDHLVVDEVFDANGLDLALIALACDANIAVTLVGDPWQALYGFRGAEPELVPKLLKDWNFHSLPLSQSFRFETPEMKDLATRLRDGLPVAIIEGGDYQVVLAAKWDQLWQAPNHVLPLSFGRTSNKTDAAAIVLLDHLVYSTFNTRAIFLPEALVLLDLDQDTYRKDGPAVLGSVVETLSGNGVDAPWRALAALRSAMKDLGAPRRPPSSSGDNEQKQLDRLALLATRLRSGRTLIPGMTIHQAKGREWDRVGVRLGTAEVSRLAAGLKQSVEPDRALYVALTRARQHVRSVA